MLTEATKNCQHRSAGRFCSDEIRHYSFLHFNRRARRPGSSYRRSIPTTCVLALMLASIAPARSCPSAEALQSIFSGSAPLRSTEPVIARVTIHKLLAGTSHADEPNDSVSFTGMAHVDEIKRGEISGNVIRIVAPNSSCDLPVKQNDSGFVAGRIEQDADGSVTLFAVAEPVGREDRQRERGRPSDTPRASGAGDSIRDILKQRKGISIEDPSRQASEPVESLLAAFPAISEPIHFAPRSSRLSAASDATLTRIGEALSHDRLGEFVFVIAGHADEVGTAEYNFALAQKRVKEVRRTLLEKFPALKHRLLAVSFGRERPKDGPRSAANRRVEIAIEGPRRAR